MMWAWQPTEPASFLHVFVTARGHSGRRNKAEINLVGVNKKDLEVFLIT